MAWVAASTDAAALPMRRVLLIGSSGAGKTTLGRELALRLGVPFVDLDDLYWDPGWVEAGHDELARRLTPTLAADGWVIAGNYRATTERHVWPRLTHLVVLDLALPRLLLRSTLRTVRRVFTGEPCCNGNRESLRRALGRDGVVRYTLRTWRRRRAYHRTLARDPRLAHAYVVYLRDAREVTAWRSAWPCPDGNDAPTHTPAMAPRP